MAELQAVQPLIAVCLGGTAAQAIFGSSARVLRDRGQWRASEFCADTLITLHPSALRRQPDKAQRDRDYADIVADLRLVAEKLPGR